VNELRIKVESYTLKVFIILQIFNLDSTNVVTTNVNSQIFKLAYVSRYSLI